MKKGLDYPGVSVVFLCHDGEGNYLLNKRSLQCRDEHGRWDCGGGAVDFGKKVEDILKKEIQEEYSTDVLEYEFLGFRDVHRKMDDCVSHWITLDFKVLVDREKVKNGEPHKFDEVQWFSLNALPDPLHSQLPAALQKYKELL